MRGPMTREEAKTTRYRTWAGSPKGTPYNPSTCAMDVPDTGRSVLSHQCLRKPGYGPDGLYCKQHAKWFDAAKGSGDAE